MLRTGMPVLNPISAAWNTVGRFDDYESAQRAVDRLSEEGFPTEKQEIIRLKLLFITGEAGAIGTGALSGLWAGLLVGALVGLFTTGHPFLAVIATGAALGAFWGAAFGQLAHARTRGHRGFR